MMATWGSYERALWPRCQRIAGVDEVGRGCLAGPVVAAAVIFPPHIHLAGVDDSKKLSARQREALCVQIQDQALAWGIGMLDAAQIDRVNILQASRQAMRLAILQLPALPDHVLVDGRDRIPMDVEQTTIVQGDARCFSVAAASILAKVTRDRLMATLEVQYPGFSFATHKGYGTPQHLRELDRYGPTPLHRQSFAPVRKYYDAAAASCWGSSSAAGPAASSVSPDTESVSSAASPIAVTMARPSSMRAARPANSRR